MGASGILGVARIRPARLALALLLAAALTGGCARKPGREAQGPDSSAPAVARSDTMAARHPGDERPAALFGPPIGARDSLIQAIRPHLVEWVALWREALHEFRLDSLRAGGWTAFHPHADGMPWPMPGYSADPNGPSSSPAMVQPAPGGRYVLLIDRYLDVSAEGSSGAEVGGEPDSAPVLLDRGTGVTSTFEFCGTGCAFHWGAWIDSTRFVLAGAADAGYPEGSVYGTLAYYDLRRGRKAVWYVPACDSAGEARYDRAWREWVLRRYRQRDVAATRGSGDGAGGPAS